MSLSRALRAARRGLCTSRKSAVVLLSGGLDSATALAIARADGFRTLTLSFDYGQRHRHELAAAATQARLLGAAAHRVARIDPAVFAGSALTDRAVPVPKARPAADMLRAPIPATYVPARNTLFLSYALAFAESQGASHIYIGANAVDYSGYPDCRPEFFHAFQRVAALGTKAGVEGAAAPTIHVPLLHCTKTQIIERGLALGVDYAMTHSCYDPEANGKPCGRCDSCILRADAFTHLGFAMDPAMERFERTENHHELRRR